MRTAWSDSARGVTTRQNAAPASWLQRVWARLRVRGGSEPADLEAPLLEFALERSGAAAKRGPVKRQRPSSNPARTWGRPSRAHVAMTVGLVALATGALVAVWLESWRVDAPHTGSVTITSLPAGETVAVDAVPRGATPATLSLAPGEHRIDIGEGASLRTRTVTIAAGGSVVMHFEMLAGVPPTSPVATTGHLRISTDPAGAQVFVDGKSYPVLPRCRLARCRRALTQSRQVVRAAGSHSA